MNKKAPNRNIKKKSNSSKEVRQLNPLKIFGAIILLVFVIIVAFYSISAITRLIKNPTETVAVKEGKLSQEETAIGYIIREETIVKGENYKNGMEQIIENNEKVAKDEAIFRYYSNAEEDVTIKIQEIDKKIQETMKDGKEELFSTDTKLIDGQIDEKLKRITDINNLQDIQEYKKSLTADVVKKAQIAGELSPSGSYLKDLINQRKELQNRLLDSSEYIIAPVSGILSYRIDGLESTLVPGDFSKYNKSFLNGLNLKVNQIIPTSNEQGKIVNNYICYIAFTSNTSEARNAEIGDKVKILLPSTKQISAEVEYIIKEDGGEDTIVLKFSEGVEELLSYRVITFDIIWWSTSGYKIPNSSIITENNLNYVIRRRVGYLDKVLVKLGKRTDTYSIVSNYSASEINELNISENAKTSILLYDEILVNPTKEKIKNIQ